MNHPPILLGTSSFMAAGWNGSFYPRGLKPADYLAFYAERFHAVEWTDADHLRHSQFVGLRDNKDAASVVKEHGGESGKVASAAGRKIDLMSALSHQSGLSASPAEKFW